MKNQILSTIFILSLIIFAAASFKAQNTDGGLPTLRGEEAIKDLKERGQFDSLSEAVNSARKDDGRFQNNLILGGGWTQESQKAAADGLANDNFGRSVAISGNTAIVGAWFDDIGINLDQGSAYIFVRSGTTWTLQQKISASDGETSDTFGNAVAIDGDTVIVGASLDDIGANNEQGSAYIFTRSGVTWTLQQKITATGGAIDDQFGTSVAISGESVIVGAYLDDVGANTDQGSAYVFTRSGIIWTQQAQLTATGGAMNDQFGVSVGIDGNTTIVGAYRDMVGANPDQGSAYVFTRSGIVWTQQAQLLAADGAMNDQFGVRVGISGNTVIVGADLDNIGANNEQGSAYIFVRSGIVWSQQQKLVASDGAANDVFGFSVAISGNFAVVGAYQADVGANSNQGSAYIFERVGIVWTQQQKLTAAGGAAFDQFGLSAAISGDRIIVGAPNSDASTSVPLAPQAFDQGAVFIFNLAPTAAGVSVSGRVTNPDDNGIRNVLVSLTDSAGVTRTVRTSTFGYYNFDDVEVGATYTINVTAKRFTFAHPTQVITVNENIDDLNFIAE